MNAPNTKLQTPGGKHQTPRSKHQGSSKSQAPILRYRCANGDLVLGISLELGVWDLVFGPAVRMTNDEILMTKEILSPTSKRKALASDVVIRSFELRHRFDIRH